MHFSLTVWAALLTLRSVAVGTSIYSQLLCVTKVSSKSTSPVPSSTTTISIPITFTSKTTVTPVKTITPPPTTTVTSTTTTQSFTTTLPKVTDTVTTTVTNTITSTSTSTETEIDTETSTAVTTETSTSTVPTPAGFTPISQELGYVPKIKGRDINKLAIRAGSTSNMLRCKPGPKPTVISPPIYPVSVYCVKYIETVTTKTLTTTGTKTSTTTLPQSTATITSKFTIATTTTVTPAPDTSTVTASETSTTSTITTTTTTSTTTVTTTSTSFVPGPTVYAACASNNIVNSANLGQGIVAFSKNDAQSFGVVNAASAYDCCVACQAANCAGTAFVGGSCYTVINSGTCTPGQFNGDYFQTSGMDEGFTVSNGPCGAIANGGSANMW